MDNPSGWGVENEEGEKKDKRKFDMQASMA